MRRFVCNSRRLAATFSRQIHTSPRLAARYSTASDVQVHEGRVYIDSVFPVQLGFLDFRRYIGYVREESLLASLSARLSRIKTHAFEVVSLQPSQKEGGVLLQFRYRTNGSDVADALQVIQTELQTEAMKDGSMPTWSSLTALGGKPWIVKGSPFLEDMERFPYTRLKVVFEGPDVHEESLYELFRPYGRIENITDPKPLPSSSFRFSVVTFHRIRSATIARNVLHGLTVPSSPSTRLRITYEPPIQAHVIRDWISNHPKTFFPILIFLLGSLTYAVFDPIRSLMIEAKMLDWFEFREFKLYKWLRKNALERLYTPSSPPSVASGNEMWKERKDAEATVRAYLSDLPTTVAFIHGPAGSGKSSMLQSVLQDTSRKSLVIDCRELMKASTDTRLVSELARQTGYWPIFTFLNSLNNLIDLASVGLIGQKAGLSSSVTDQVQEILSVVSTALKGVSSSHRAAIEKQILHQQKLAARKASQEQRRQRIEHGLWHDGRIDCVAGNGIISELGFGDERIWDGDEPTMTIQGTSVTPEREEEAKKHSLHREVDAEAVDALPIVVIRNFAAKTGSNRTELLNVLAQWAANLAENQIAHVIVISDNRENVKRIAKALPTKPLTSIALHDADAASSLSFVQRKLRESGIEVNLGSQIAYIERLGGRASDLESLIHKVRNGQSVQDAVEDIIVRGVGELRKNAFGDDVEDAKSLPWSREQAWAVLKQLSRSPEIPYHDVLLDYPFKGDEAALRSMEHAELITINTYNGRPSTIRPGKPVLYWVFERLVNDTVFQAIQEIAFNEKMIANAEATVKACEQELLTLKEITKDASWLSSHSASNSRASYLSKKMYAAEKKIEALEKKNTNWKYLLSKNNSNG